MFGQIDEIKNLAFKYSKEQLGRMAQMGMIDPQKAMMAGMMRDRVSKEDTKPPTTTVAQDILAPQQPQQQMGMQQPQQPQQMGMPQQAPAPQAPAQMAATGGITSLPVQEQDYAGGGIVAFADGGSAEYEYTFDPATGTYKQIGDPKEKEAPVDTRQHLGAAGLGIFGSEGMDLITGLPKGNMRDPVLGFADGGVAHYANAGYVDSEWEGLRNAGRPLAGSMGEFVGNIFSHNDEKIDPVTGERITLGEFLRRQEAEKSALYTPAAQQIAASKGVSAGQTFPPTVAGASDSVTTPFGNKAPTGVAAAPGAPKVNADKAPAGPAAPRLPALNRPSGKIDIEKYDARPVQELDVLAKERSEAYRKAGIDPDLYKSMIEKEEGKREGLGKRKEEAKGEFLMNLGLGLTQARRGQEFAALGAGAKEGLASYKESMKDVRVTEEKLDDRINSFRLADQQAKKTGTDADIAKRDRQAELVEAAKIKNIDARNTANTEQAKIGANLYATDTAANTARYVAQVHQNTQKEMNTLVKQGQLDAKVAQVLLTSEKNFMDANANNFIGKPEELARAARAHAIEAAKVYLPNSAVANSSMAPTPAPTADIYKNKYGITPTKG